MLLKHKKTGEGGREGAEGGGEPGKYSWLRGSNHDGRGKRREPCVAFVSLRMWETTYYSCDSSRDSASSDRNVFVSVRNQPYFTVMNSLTRSRTFGKTTVIAAKRRYVWRSGHRSWKSLEKKLECVKVVKSTVFYRRAWFSEEHATLDRRQTYCRMENAITQQAD